jgi:hypothetical protein
METINKETSIKWVKTILEENPKIKDDNKEYNTVIRKSFKFNNIEISYYKINKLKNLININNDLEYIISNF